MSVRRAGLWVSLAVLLAALLEAVLRVAFGFGHPLLYTPDGSVGYLPRPNQALHRLGAAININAYGMRSEEVASTVPAGHNRLLFIGDFVTFGTTYVDRKEIFTELLKADYVRRYGDRVEVLNASAGGWAPADEYEFLKSRGTLGAQLVVFVPNTNDLDQPFAPLENSPAFPTANPATALGEVWVRYVRPRLGVALRQADPGSESEATPNLQEAGKVLQTMRAAKQLAESQGARFAIIFSPSSYPKMNNAAWRSTLAAFEKWAESAHVPWLDMTPSYARYPPAEIYFDNIHLRPLGHRLVAEAFEAQFPAAAVAQ